MNRVNRVRWLQLSADTTYSLSERFQLAENVRAMRLIRRSMIAIAFATAINITLVLLTVVVNNPVVGDIVWKTAALLVPLYVIPFLLASSTVSKYRITSNSAPQCCT